MIAGYEILRRPPALGGGWKVRLLVDGEEVGGGVWRYSVDAAGFDWAYCQASEFAAIWLKDEEPF